MAFSDKVNVLGTEYRILLEVSNLTPKLRDAYGYIEQFSKKIVLYDWPEGAETVELPDCLRAITLRHEIIHAFFEECGLSGYSEDETLVQCLSWLIPKMVAAFQEAGAYAHAGP